MLLLFISTPDTCTDIAIETGASWDAIIFCSPKVKEELVFWHNNVNQLNGKKLFDEPHVFDSVVYYDALEQCYGVYVILGKQNLVCQGRWIANQKGKEVHLARAQSCLLIWRKLSFAKLQEC